MSHLQYDGVINSDPLLSKRRLEDTLTSGYFEMLGTLSRHPEGVVLLTKFKFFTRFYHLSDLRSREDLIKAIIENLDYTTDGHPRIVLSKALTSSYMHIRLYATQHLGRLVLASAGEANEWTLRLLITQLYDPSTDVCEMAVHFLEEACEAPAALEMVVGMRPFLEHLGDVGHPLLLRFLSTSVGFSYLCQVQYIEREMDFWLHVSRRSRSPFNFALESPLTFRPLHQLYVSGPESPLRRSSRALPRPHLLPGLRGRRRRPRVSIRPRLSVHQRPCY